MWRPMTGAGVVTRSPSRTATSTRSPRSLPVAAASRAAWPVSASSAAVRAIALAAVSVPAMPTDAAGRQYRPVMMAVATSGGGLINQHFGHAREFLIYEASTSGVRFIGHRKVDQYCIGNDTCGEKDSALSRRFGTLVCPIARCR